MKSVWKSEIVKPKFDTLSGDIKTDVLIIGGGMAGILCGYALQNSGVDCVIAEQSTICGGVTQNTTAKVTYHHGAIFDEMLSTYGTEITEMYVKSQNNALQEYKRLAQEIDCDFFEENSFVYTLNDREKIEKEVDALNKVGVPAEFVTNLDLPLDTLGAVEVKNQARFHPLKFAYSVAGKLKIFENTKVIEVTADGAITDKGKIKAEKIIVATHFPFINKYGAYFMKMYQHRSYVIALKNAADVRGIYIDEAQNGLSFRNHNELLLLGGGGHRTGKDGGNWKVLREFAAEKYPQAQEVTYWATQDCETLDDIPYIGQYSKRTPNLFVATGFNKWGMTSSMVSAQILCDLVQGKENEFARAYSPSRTSLHPQLFINGAETVVNLLTPTAPRCPHLGCALKYNKVEHSWDCPCHGSRFAEDGKLLDNPATDDKHL